ncbi:TolC family outer membrane protein [Xenorhabdus bovienii]|uniref:TolC family outer membrane protein n=1 Tax=Xenorhabdus bovienii TaxID=40576 RepID=A0AAJ1JBU3_XENBV|nr:TolC family outer membrane protein [Xenorhabdus bovienii]MDE1478983.1 TolC family outer membrane protein [Xenorhabdus bovienii]MDE9510673.1 TolC family outer membrane protein [Xenorhabdus bovienii]MDE9522310.1 TolC family outer membrane protein [Xenorhabdus bovienii]
MFRSNGFTGSVLFLPLFLLMSFSGTVQALSLTEAYALALQHDPTFQAAIKAQEAGQEEKNLGRAELLPKLAFNYQYVPQNWQKMESSSSDSGRRGNTITESRNRQYHSYSGSLVLTQPLVDFEAWARYKTRQAYALMSDARFRVDTQQLAVRVVNNYVDVAYAQDRLAQVAQQRRAYEEQLERNQKLFASGEGTRTDVAETQARYSQVVADELTVKDELDAAIRDLQLLVGTPLPDDLPVNRLSPVQNFKTIKLAFAHYADWEQMALSQNPQLAEARQKVAVAAQDIERNRAGYLPKLELYASHTENKSSSDNIIDQKYRTDSIGLRVSMNLYNGGGTSAAVRQSAANYGRAKYEMDAEAGETLNALRRNYNACMNGEKRIRAYESAVEAAELQVKATQKSVALGQRVNVDILNAEQQLYMARRDLSQAKYQYMKSWIGLLSESGQLNGEHIQLASGYFE